MIVANLAIRIAAAIFSVPPEVISPCLPMMAPIPTSPAENLRREAAKEALATGWRPRDGFDAPPSDERLVDGIDAAEGTRPSTYGEVTELGARQLFHHLGTSGNNEKDVGVGDVLFFDLGSGVGKLVVQAFLELPRLRRAVGIELSPARHAAAIRSWEGLLLSGTANTVRAMGGDQLEASVELLQGDLFRLDVSEATHIYVASLCFSDEMIHVLADKLAAEASNLRCVATLQPFPPTDAFGSNPRMEFVEMSWTKARGEGCAVYFYDRRLPSGQFQ